MKHLHIIPSNFKAQDLSWGGLTSYNREDQMLWGLIEDIIAI